MLTLGDLVVFLKGDRSHLDRTLDSAEAKSRSVAGSIGGFFKNAFSFATGELITRSLNGIVNAIGSVKDAMIGGNTAFEQYQTQFQVLLGNADLAQARMQELAEFGQRTPFELPELVQADRILQSFGLHAPDVVEHFRQMGIDLRTITGDMAAGTGASFQEIAKYLGRFSAGGVGEALERFAELGIVTRSELAAMGVEFAKSGELVSPLNEAFDILLQVVQQKFGGMMEAQSQTFGGMLSNLQDWIGNAARTLGEPIFDRLKEGLQGFLELVQPGSPVDSAIKEFANTIRLALAVAGTLLGMLTGGGLGSAIEGWATALTEKLQQVNDFLRQLKDEMLGLTAGDILGELGPGLENLNQQMNKSLSDLSTRHNQVVSGLQQQLANAGEKLGQDLAAINEKYADKIEDLNERIADTAENFQERLSDLTEQHGKQREKLEKQIAKTIADREEKLTDLKKEHARRRRELTMNLLTAESEEQYLSIQAQIKAEDEKYNEQKGKAKKAGDEQISELKTRLDEENAEYEKQASRLRKQRDEALAGLNEQLAEVQAEKAKEVAATQASYDQQVKLLNDKIAAENAAYAQQQEEIRAMYAQRMADFQADIEARAAAIGQGPAAQLGAMIRDAVAAFNEFRDSAAAVWAEIQKIVGVFQEQGFWAGVGAFTEWVTQKLSEASVAINTWVNDPANQEQFRNWGSRAAQTLVDGFVQVLTGGDSAAILSANFALAFANLWVSIQTIPINLASQFLLGFITTFTSPENVEKLKTTIATTLREANEFWGNTLAEWADGLSEWWGNKLAEWAGIITNFDWSSVGANIVAGIKSGLETAWGELTAWLAEKAAQLPDWVNNPLGANSPATKLMPTGKSFVQGIQVGAEKEMDSLRQSLGQAMQSLIPAQPAAGSLAGAVGGPTYITAAPTFNLPAAPAGFDRAGLMNDIHQKILELLAQLYTNQG